MAIPLVNAGFQIGVNALNRHWRRKEESGRRKYEQRMEADRRKYDQEMWAKVNKYNHPLQQMQRLAEAGLNPNLIYGSSPGSAVGNAQSIATGKQLQGQAPQYQMDNPITPFMDTRVKQAQTNNLKADVLLKGTQAEKNLADAGKTAKDTELLASRFDDLVGLTASENAIKQIQLMVQNRTRYQQILQSFNQTNKETLALRIQQWEFDNMQKSNMMRGFNIYNLGSALGLDLNTKEGRETMSIVSRLTAGTKVFGLFSQGLKSIISAGKNMFGKVAKHSKKFYRN